MNAQNPVDLPLLDDDAIADLRDIMEDDFADLVETFLNDLPGQVAAIAAAQNDAEQLYRSAHKLKSGSGSIGAPRLAEQARLLEQMGRNQELGPVPLVLDSLHTVADQTRTALRDLLGT